MHIELDTDRISRGSALALVALIAEEFPDIIRTAGGWIGGELAATHDEDEAPKLDPATAFAAPPILDPALAFGSNGAPIAAAPLQPATPAAPVPPAAPGPSVDLDIQGIPHDNRIHASTKTKKQDGAWTRRKGISSDLYNGIIAELKASRPTVTGSVPLAALTPDTSGSAAPASPPLPAPSASSPPPPAPPLPVGAPLDPAAVAAAQAQALADPSLGAPAPPAAAPMGDFYLVMQKVSNAQRDGLLTTADVVAIQSALGFEVKDLVSKPNLIPQFEQRVDAYIAAAAATRPAA